MQVAIVCGACAIEARPKRLPPSQAGGPDKAVAVGAENGLGHKASLAAGPHSHLPQHLSPNHVSHHKNSKRPKKHLGSHGPSAHGPAAHGPAAHGQEAYQPAKGLLAHIPAKGLLAQNPAHEGPSSGPARARPSRSPKGKPHPIEAIGVTKNLGVNISGNRKAKRSADEKIPASAVKPTNHGTGHKRKLAADGKTPKKPANHDTKTHSRRHHKKSKKGLKEQSKETHKKASEKPNKAADEKPKKATEEKPKKAAEEKPNKATEEKPKEQPEKEPATAAGAKPAAKPHKLATRAAPESPEDQSKDQPKDGAKDLKAPKHLKHKKLSKTPKSLKPKHLKPKKLSRHSKLNKHGKAPLQDKPQGQTKKLGASAPHSVQRRFLGLHRHHKVYLVQPQPPAQVVFVRKHKHRYHKHRPKISVHFGLGR